MAFSYKMVKILYRSCFLSRSLQQHLHPFPFQISWRIIVSDGSSGSAINIHLYGNNESAKAEYDVSSWGRRVAKPAEVHSIVIFWNFNLVFKMKIYFY